MPLHYHDFITPKSSGNAAIGKAVALGFLFLLVALGDDFFAQANTVGLEVEERAFRYGENLHYPDNVLCNLLIQSPGIVIAHFLPFRFGLLLRDLAEIGGNLKGKLEVENCPL